MGKVRFFYTPLLAVTMDSIKIQALLQSHSHQDSMVLVQRQKYRSMNKIESPEIKSCYAFSRKGMNSTPL